MWFVGGVERTGSLSDENCDQQELFWKWLSCINFQSSQRLKTSQRAWGRLFNLNVKFRLKSLFTPFTAYAWLILFKNTPTIGSLGYFRNLNFFITYLDFLWTCRLQSRWQKWMGNMMSQISKDLHGVVKADFFTQWYVESWLQETVI